MAIEMKFPDNYCKRCDQCVLVVKDRNGVTTVSCKLKSVCPKTMEWGGSDEEETEA